MRGIVDVCLSVDPRIKRIKQEEKEARDAKKKGKAGTPQNQKAKEEEEKKRAEEEAKKKEEEEKVGGILPLSFRLVSRCRRSLGSKRRKIKLRRPTRQRKPAGRREPQNSQPLDNKRWSSSSSHHTKLGGLYLMPTELRFPWFLSSLSAVLAWGSVLDSRFRVGLTDSPKGLTLRTLGITLLFGMPSVFPCSISALSSANVRVGTSSSVACWSFPVSRLLSTGRAADSSLVASSNVIEFPVSLQSSGLRMKIERGEDEVDTKNARRSSREENLGPVLANVYTHLLK